jgi:orotidine-5'-phosphate decarboxylase
MNKVRSYRQRITQISNANKSFIILALDLEARYQNLKYIEKMIRNLYPFLCAIKINFHLLLPFNKRNIENMNKIIHSYGLMSIADIKLNDVTNTNQETLKYLHLVGFDSVIINPIIGGKELTSLVRLAHKFGMGVISLAYMSHENATEGYGLEVVRRKSNENKILPLFELFLQYAKKSNVDGIVVGATHLRILKHISTVSNIPIYSPGVGTQGGKPKSAINSGSSYLIIGRSILHSKNKRKTLSRLLDLKEF